MYPYGPPQGTILVGVSAATLQQWLTQAQTALQALMTGQRVVSASYGDKNIQYTQAEVPALVQWIHLLQRQLNIVRPRRAITPYFR